MFDLSLGLNTDFLQKLSELYVEDFLVHNRAMNVLGFDGEVL